MHTPGAGNVPLRISAGAASIVGAGVMYHSPENKFERFHGFLESISRFEFDFRRCGFF